MSEADPFGLLAEQQAKKNARAEKARLNRKAEDQRRPLRQALAALSAAAPNYHQSELPAILLPPEHQEACLNALLAVGVALRRDADAGKRLNEFLGARPGPERKLAAGLYRLAMSQDRNGILRAFAELGQLDLFPDQYEVWKHVHWLANSLSGEFTAIEWPREETDDSKVTETGEEQRERGQTATPPPQPPLKNTAKAALAVIPRGGKKGISGKEIVTALKKKKVNITESTLRKHILPMLKTSHGVENQRSIGGYYRP